MYNVTSIVKAMFDNNYKQVIRITCNPVTGDSFTLDENDIISGSLSIDRYSVTGDRIEIGTASAGELSFKIKNYSSEWANTKFEGCEMYVRIGIADWTQNPTESQINFIPCGYFTVDKPVKNAQILEITALDRMAKFDKYVDTASLLATYNPRTLIDFCCTQCGVVLANGSDITNYPNADYSVAIPENVGELTYRNLLQSACMLLGTCAFIDWNGLLRIGWYTFSKTVGSELLDLGNEFWGITHNESSTGNELNIHYSPISKEITIDGSISFGITEKLADISLNAGSYILSGVPRGTTNFKLQIKGNGVEESDTGSGVTFVIPANGTYSVNLVIPAGNYTFDNVAFKPSIYQSASNYVCYTSSKRYSHTIQEKDIEITGVYYAYEDEERVLHEYIKGTKDYCLDISDNPFINRQTVESAVQALGTALVGFRYRPLTMSVKPAPYLYPMDMFDFVTADGDTVHGIVSKITFGVNARTHIESNGQTNEDNGYATYGNFTSVQSKIIEKAKTQISRVVNERTAMLLNLNEMIANSLGLYVTAVPVTGGGNQYYFHDGTTLASSNIIYTFTANGLAWTDDWNGGSPAWQYGITRDGNAILNMLNAYKISADIISGGVLMADVGNNYWNLRTGEFYNSMVTKSTVTVQNYILNPLLNIRSGETVPDLWEIIGSDTAEVVNDAGMGMCWHFISTTDKCGARNNAGVLQIDQTASKVYVGANVKVVQSGHYSNLGYKVRAQLTVQYSDNTVVTLYSAAYVDRLNTAQKVTFEFEPNSSKTIKFLDAGFYNTYISTQETTQETYYADMWCSLVNVSESESFTINATQTGYQTSTIDYVKTSEVGHVLMNDEKAEFVGTRIEGSNIISESGNYHLDIWGGVQTFKYGDYQRMQLFQTATMAIVRLFTGTFTGSGETPNEYQTDYTPKGITVYYNGTIMFHFEVGSDGTIVIRDGNGHSLRMDSNQIRLYNSNTNTQISLSDTNGLGIYINGSGYNNLGWVDDGNGHAVLGK